jgi:hypothetical protein
MKVSIVIEWETVLEGKVSRGAACLASVREQVAQMASCETVVCFDPAEATEASVRFALGAEWPGTLIVEPVPSHLDYYQKKNHGFALTRGEIVVFLDSDLVPERDWLRSLVDAFEDYRVSLVVGRTHLDTSTLYERAVAMFWIFDARDQAPLRPTRRLVSNNVAVRRALFTHFPFPDRPTFRGQCSELASILTARRITMYEQPAARASHPAPEGARRFLSRAWHAGRDHVFYDALDGIAGAGQVIRNWRTDLRHVRERIAVRAPLIGARAADVAAAFLLGLVYYTVKLAGAAASVSRVPRQSALPAGKR